MKHIHSILYKAYLANLEALAIQISGIGSTGAPGAGAPMNRSYNQLVPFYSGVGTTGTPGAGAPYNYP